VQLLAGDSSSHGRSNTLRRPEMIVFWPDHFGSFPERNFTRCPRPRLWTATKSPRRRSNAAGPWWTYVDGRFAVFKTVCGALLRRPGWVRFPSIPANFRAHESQDDSNSSGHRRMAADQIGRLDVQQHGPQDVVDFARQRPPWISSTCGALARRLPSRSITGPPRPPARGWRSAS